MMWWTIAQGSVFSVWACLCLRSAFRLAAVQKQASQPEQHGPLMAMRLFLTDNRFHHDRRVLGLLTLLLLIMAAVFGMRSQPGF